MRVKNCGNDPLIGSDWTASDRRAALRVMHRARLRPAATVSSGWGTDVARSDPRSVHASLHGHGDLRVAWWNLYSRLYMRLVPGADLERAMCSFHKMHHRITLGWLGYLGAVHEMRRDIERHGVVAALKTMLATDGYSSPR